MKHVVRTLAIALCTLCSVHVLSAQIDSVTPPNSEPPFIKKWSGKISGDGMLQTGNTERVLVSVRGEQTVTSSSFEFDATQQYMYGEQAKVKLESDGLAWMNLVLFPENTLQALAFGAAEFSHLRSIDLRWQIGVGPKFVLINDSLHVLKMSAVALFDRTDFYDTTRQSTRFSVRMKGKHTIIPNALRFLHESYFQPAFTDFSDLRWQTRLTIEAPIWKGFSLQTTFRYWHETVVAAGKKQNDLYWTVGVGYGW